MVLGPAYPTGGGGTPDETSEGRIPVKVGDEFVDSPLSTDAISGKVVSDTTVRANLEAATGSIAFEDTTILSTNTDCLEIQDCVRGDQHEFTTSRYDDTGSMDVLQSVKGPLQEFPVHLITGDLSGDFATVFPTLQNVHFKEIVVMPSATGVGRFTVRDTDENGCILNTETLIDFQVTHLSTEVVIPLNNRIKLFAGQFIWVSYEGPVLMGKQYSGDPTWGDQFVPWVKTMSQPFTDHHLLRADEYDPNDRRLDVFDMDSMVEGVTGKILTQAERDKLTSLTGGRYLGVFVNLVALQTAHPIAVSGDTATVTTPNGNLYYWNGTAWTDSGTGYIGDMLKVIYDPTAKNSDVFSMGNMDETATAKILTGTERTKITNTSGTNTGDVTLNPSDTTQETIDLTGQEITVNLATTTTDGALLAGDKLKLDNIMGNGCTNHWVSGLEVSEASPKGQSVDYTAGTYLIGGVLKTIVLGGNLDLISYYAGLTSYQHRFVILHVDVDETVEAMPGPVVEKDEIPPLPICPPDSVCIALVEIEVDKNAIPKDIKDKQITDTRNAPAFNTDKFVACSPDDLGVGYLSDKLSNNGNVEFTIENVGGIETIKADVPGIGDVFPSINYTTNTHIDGLDVTSLYPRGHIFCDAGGDIELRSFANGQDKQIIMLTNLSRDRVKIKHQSGTSQEARCEGGIDTSMDEYGGATLVYHASTGYWYTIQIT